MDELVENIKLGHLSASMTDILLRPSPYPDYPKHKFSKHEVSYSHSVFDFASYLLSEKSREEIDKAFETYLNTERKDLFPNDMFPDLTAYHLPDHRDLRFQATFKLALDILALYEVQNCDNKLLERYLDFYYELTS